MSIIRFVIPSVVLPVVSQFDTAKIVDAVQSAINAGTVLKSSSKQTPDWKTVKDDEGNERLVINVTSKANERLQLENTIGARFYGWCNAMVRLQTFGETKVILPDCFAKWFGEKFAKNNTH